MIQGERRSELLGFPPTARVLIVNCDDLGMYHAVNAAVVASIEFLDSFRLDVDRKPEQYAELLRALPAGVSEWAVHPSLGDDESRTVDPSGWRVRRTDYEFLTSPEARELVRQEDIVLTDYRQMQQVWACSGRP